MFREPGVAQKGRCDVTMERKAKADHVGPVDLEIGVGLDSGCCVVPLQAFSRMMWSHLGRDVQSSLGVRVGELALALCWPQSKAGFWATAAHLGL